MRSTFIHSLVVVALALAFTTATPMAQAQSRYEDLANLPFKEGYIAKDNVQTLLEELFFERAVQSYLWALPALNMYGDEGRFGEGLRQRAITCCRSGRSGSMPRR